MNKGVYIFGISGRMGQEVKKLVESTPGLELLGGYSRSQAGNTPERSPDIVIDFSLPETLPHLKEFIAKHNSCLVSGTTGLSEAQKLELKGLGSFSPVFWAANMSFGVYLMCQLVEKLARYDQFYNFNIEETHHIHKKDKPSGTALIVEESAKKSTSHLGQIKSIREGEVFGIHRFLASSKNESLEIKHEAYNRSLFAQGALDISSWLCQQPPGFYSMDDFFKNF